jgi:hypothetical protein
MLYVPNRGIRSARDLFYQKDSETRTYAPADCPKCGEEDDIWPEVGPAPYGLYCRKCGWGGPREALDDEDPGPAITAWNEEVRKIGLARELGLTVNLVQPPPEAEDVC